MYHFTVYSDTYFKNLEVQGYFIEMKFYFNGVIADIADNNTTDSIKFKDNITGPIGNDGTKNVEIFK